MNPVLWLTVISIGLLSQSVVKTQGAAAQAECSQRILEQCANDADALLRDPALVFPDSPSSIEKVCRLWSDFTSCLNDYTRRCLNKNAKDEFDRSLHEPVLSMLKLCQDKENRKEYLRSAPCVKKVLTEPNYCGNQYRFFIDQVSGSTANMKQVCCAREKFKRCIQTKMPEKCDMDKRDPNGRKLVDEITANATVFTLTSLDRSILRCSYQSFREEDCPGIDMNSMRGNSKGPLAQSELDAAASAEQSTHFQLGQPRPQNQQPLSNRRPEQSKGQTDTLLPTKKMDEKPKTDKLSSATQNDRYSGGNSSRNEGNALTSIMPTHVFLSILASVSVLKLFVDTR